jgi:hypothetical protein
MRHIGALIFIIAVLAIIVGGRYHNTEKIESSLQLQPTSRAQPQLVEATLLEYDGIYSVRLSQSENRLDVVYDRAQISQEDLEHILAALGYRLLPEQPATRAAM